jgi:hypothetical protein
MMYPLKGNQSYALARPACSPAAIGITIFVPILGALIERKFSAWNLSVLRAPPGVV